MALDPRLLRSLVVLADELHYGRAARRLHVAQPALSQQIKRLEAQLGVELFERTRHSVALTPSGEAVLPFARQAIAATDAVREAAEGAAAGRGGTLRLGLTPGVHYFAERVLRAFAAEHPGARVRALDDNSGAVAREVAAGNLEVALGFATAPAAGVRMESLGSEAAVVAVSAQHRLATRRDVRLADLQEETFALVDPRDGRGYNDAVRELCRGAGFEPGTAPNPSGPMAWESAVRGGCVGLTTRISVASSLRGLKVLRLRDAAAFRIDLLTPAAAPPAPLAQTFAHLARVMHGGS